MAECAPSGGSTGMPKALSTGTRVSALWTIFLPFASATSARLTQVACQGQPGLPGGQAGSQVLGWQVYALSKVPCKGLLCPCLLTVTSSLCSQGRAGLGLSFRCADPCPHNLSGCHCDLGNWQQVPPVEALCNLGTPGAWHNLFLLLRHAHTWAGGHGR